MTSLISQLRAPYEAECNRVIGKAGACCTAAAISTEVGMTLFAMLFVKNVTWKSRLVQVSDGVQPCFPISLLQ